MHFKNGREAKENDQVICSAGGYGKVLAGTLHSLNAGVTSCNAQLAYAVPGAIYNACVTIGDCYHAEDALAAITPKVETATAAASPCAVTALLALLLFLCFGTTACKTTTTNVVTQGANGPVTNAIDTTTLLGVTITPSGVYNTLRGGTATGARIAIQSDTNSLAYLVALRLVIGDAIASTNYNPAALAAAVNALPISSIHNATAVEAIQGGFAAFEVLEPIIDAKVQSQNQFLKPALQGIFDGIGDALGITAPPLPVTGYEARLLLPYEVFDRVQNRLFLNAKETAFNQR